MTTFKTRRILFSEMGEFIINMSKQFGADLGELIVHDTGILFRDKFTKFAPRFISGSLKDKTQVTIHKFGKNRIEISAPKHWDVVNKGLFPKTRLPVEVIEKHNQNPGSTVGKKISEMFNKNELSGKTFQPKRSSGVGFVDRAARSAQRKLPKTISRIIGGQVRKL